MEKRKSDNWELDEMLKQIENIERKAALGLITDEDKKDSIRLQVKVNDLEMSKHKDIQQKARLRWLKFGDENSSYFHKVVTLNLARNRINSLIFNGTMIADLGILKEEIRNWFKKQFSEPIRRRPDFDSVGLPIVSDQLGQGL